MKTKMFTKMNRRNKPEPANSEFEDEVNEWLQSNPNVEIRHIRQSAGGGSMGPFLFFITIWYHEKSAN